MIREVVFWLIVGALIVLVITHPRGFSQSATTVGEESNKILGTLSGQNQPTG